MSDGPDCRMVALRPPGNQGPEAQEHWCSGHFVTPIFQTECYFFILMDYS